MTNALTALAERVEAASGPSRELGHEILLACGWRRTSVGHFYGPLYQWSSPDGRRSFPEENLPNPTASIDAALTLVPDAWPKRLSEIRFGMWRVEMWQGDKSFKSPPDIDQVAASWPLALCAAVLRARAATPTEQAP